MVKLKWRALCIALWITGCAFGILPIILYMLGISEYWIITTHWLLAITMAAEMGACLKSDLQKRFLLVSISVVLMLEVLCLIGFVLVPLVFLKHSLVPTGFNYHGLHAIVVWCSIVGGYIMSPRIPAKNSEQ